MHASRHLALLMGVLAASLSVGHAETPEELQKRVLEQTKLNRVVAESLPNPVAQYNGDGDATTLEIVLLTKKSDGPSRVTEGGEVISFTRLQTSCSRNSSKVRLKSESPEPQVKPNGIGGTHEECLAAAGLLFDSRRRT